MIIYIFIVKKAQPERVPSINVYNHWTDLQAGLIHINLEQKHTFLLLTKRKEIFAIIPLGR